MEQQKLFQFSGPGLVRQLGYDRSGVQPRLVITVVTEEGQGRLLFVNPEPEEELFAILNCEELFVYADEAPHVPGRIKVEFWVNGFHQLRADQVLDLATPDPKADHDTQEQPDPAADYRTGPLPE